ncbi:HAD family hydrolase [Barrientosiimonas marina]|uniref:Phosphoserine phosphatase n=1 Tax=Lentibacillus kimchii TaxID=1542911 RepID=A0ABW2UUU5_9BACI
MLKAIFLDLDNTLIWDKKSVDEALKTACELAAEKSDADPGQLEQAIRERAPELFTSFDTYNLGDRIGISPLEGLWADADNEHPGVQLTKMLPEYRRKTWTTALQQAEVDDPHLAGEIAETFKQERETRQFVYEETFEVLNKLREHYQLLLLTNGLTGLQQKKLSITPALKAYFDQIVISGSYGKGKPDPAIFEHACGLTSVHQNEALMVGDNPYTDIAGAARAGIPSVWLNHHAEDVQDVRPTYEVSRLSELLEVVAKLK